jgi:predicted AAA+ superfamily ATPase
MSAIEPLLQRLEQLLVRIEARLPPLPAPPDWSATAYYWRHQAFYGYLQPVAASASPRLADLLCIDEAKQRTIANTRQFLAGLPANHVLIWGPRGTGKSSLIKALLGEYAGQGLRLIEVDRDHLADLPDIIEQVASRPERFILFCDDLSFEAQDTRYKTLKVILDGSVRASAPNALVYATSNRRHLLPEPRSDNWEAQIIDGELHQSESVEERISLSERFGLWLPLHPFSQDEYLLIVQHWLQQLSAAEGDSEPVRHAALQWALRQGSRSGRSAWQFAKDWAGQQALSAP